jgi:hypothetical protein
MINESLVFASGDRVYVSLGGALTAAARPSPIVQV